MRVQVHHVGFYAGRCNVEDYGCHVGRRLQNSYEALLDLREEPDVSI